eukprot:SAG31_NODE_487_length_14980_cov_9.526376_13_plen_116_part_00
MPHCPPAMEVSFCFGSKTVDVLVDSIEVYPQGHPSVGTVSIEVDNEYQLFVNEQLIGTGNHWDQSNTYTFSAPCNQPTVYSVHGIDYEQEPGVDLAGIIGQFEHCSEGALETYDF